MDKKQESLEERLAHARIALLRSGLPPDLLEPLLSLSESYDTVKLSGTTYEGHVLRCPGSLSMITAAVGKVMNQARDMLRYTLTFSMPGMDKPYTKRFMHLLMASLQFPNLPTHFYFSTTIETTPPGVVQYRVTLCNRTTYQPIHACHVIIRAMREDVVEMTIAPDWSPHEAEIHAVATEAHALQAEEYPLFSAAEMAHHAALALPVEEQQAQHDHIDAQFVADHTAWRARVATWNQSAPERLRQAWVSAYMPATLTTAALRDGLAAIIHEEHMDTWAKVLRKAQLYLTIQAHKDPSIVDAPPHPEVVGWTALFDWWYMHGSKTLPKVADVWKRLEEMRVPGSQRSWERKKKEYDDAHMADD